MKAARLAPQWRSSTPLRAQCSSNTLAAYSGISRARTFSCARPAHSAQDSPIPPPRKRQRNGSSKDKLADREILLSVLSTTATKRDAKAYLSQFNAQKSTERQSTPTEQNAAIEAAGQEKHRVWKLGRSGVNLGSLYAPARAIEQSPVFAQHPLPDKPRLHTSLPLHVAVLKIREPQVLDDDILSGVALTLSQLSRLGLHSAVVLDCDGLDSPEHAEPLNPELRELAMKQAARLAAAVNTHSNANAIVVTQSLKVESVQQDVPSRVPVRGGVEVVFADLLIKPMSDGRIPILPAIAYNSSTQAVRVHPDDVVLALTREFSNISKSGRFEKSDRSHQDLSAGLNSAKIQTSLDRVIVLDPLGGIPAQDHADKAHVFINLEQEYHAIRRQLCSTGATIDTPFPQNPKGAEIGSMFGDSNPISRFVENNADLGLKPPGPDSSKATLQPLKFLEAKRHLKNLDLLQRALTLLPPASSALLTTPEEAASSALAKEHDGPSLGVATRRKRNPLIHNLLTDKPTISSSLPAARLTKNESEGVATVAATLPHATFLKRGMPVTIIPSPGPEGWIPPGPEGTTLDLRTDPRIDFSRLLHLIEDSFSRKLDVQHYLSRVETRIAGVIIAGEYEGGAILTWETPLPPHFSRPSFTQAEPRPLVPYLDKFAVLKRSQGAGGVADIVFNAMVRTGFPHGVVWRSRRDNPVNKWYFERAVGTWKIPQTGWTMFWTGDEVHAEALAGKSGTGVEEERTVSNKSVAKSRWKDYVSVCSSIQASWADQKPPD